MKKWAYRLEALLLIAVLAFCTLGSALPAETDTITEAKETVAAVPESEADSAPESEADSEAESAPESEVDSAPESEESAEKESIAKEPEDEGEDISEESSEVSQNTAAPDSEAESAPDSEAESAPDSEAESAPESEESAEKESIAEGPEDEGEISSPEDPSADLPKDNPLPEEEPEAAPDASAAAVLPIAAASEIDISDWSGTLSYYEKNAPFVAGKNNVLILTVKSFGDDSASLNSASFQNFFENDTTRKTFSFELKKDETAISSPPSLTPYGTTTGTKLYWELGDTIKENGAGTYSLTVKCGEKSFPTDDCEIVKVTFDTGTRGTFADGGTTYEGYGMKNTEINKFNVPGVTPTSQAFIGWSESSEASTYEEVVDRIGAENETLYAAYGTAKTYGFEVQQEGEACTTIELGSENYTTGAYSAEGTVKIKNTGNTMLTGLRLTGTPKNFTVSGTFDSVEANNSSGEITIKPRDGLAVGDYNETITFLAASGHNASLGVHFTVTKPTVTVTLTGDVTKKYGEGKNSGDVSYTTSLEETSLGNWKPVFTSPGFASGAAVGDYAIALDPSAEKPSNYDVKLNETSASYKVKVERATPQDVNVTATGVQEGKNLQDSKLSGTFQNPYDSSMKVKGTLTWDDAKNTGTATTNLQPGQHTFTWKFTPDGTDAGNYTEASGTASVVVSAKIPTEILLTSNAEPTYNGQPHGLDFTTNRPAGEPGTVEVQYKLEDGDGAYSPVTPTKAGTYDVKASIAESATYAGAEQTFTMTIKKRPLSISVAGGGKTYDGTTEVKGQLSFHYDKLSSDEVNLETSDYTAHFGSPNVGNQTVYVTIHSLSGKDAGNYKPATSAHGVAVIAPAAITKVTPKDSIRKQYGATHVLTAEEFDFEGLVENETASALTAEFLCEGQGARADAGDYPITVNLHGGNYVLKDPSAGTMTVTKVSPRLLPDTLHVGKGVAGKPLRIVSISAGFVNPNDSSMSVPGEVAWQNGAEIMQDDVGGKYFAAWTFTPDDTKNYEIPTDLGKAEIILVDAIPVPFTVAEKEYVYNGTPQGPAASDVRAEAVDDAPLGEVEIQIEYRRYVELAKVASVSSPESVAETDWSLEKPTNAGQYQAKIRVSPAEETLYTENENTFSFFIEKATPDISGVQKEFQIKEGLSLREADILLKSPTGVSGESLPGTFSWEDWDTPVADDGEVHQWMFTPEDARNYYSVSGSVTIRLAPDGREISAEVYNLPSAHGYTDYAVIHAKESELLPGDEVAFYKDAGCTESVSGSVVFSGEEEELSLEFNEGALSTAAGGLYARITSSKKHTATEIAYSNEIDLELPETLTVYTGGTRELAAKAIGENFQNVSFEVEKDHSAEVITVTNAGETEDIYTLQVRGNETGSASVIVVAIFPHPDQTRHKGETLTLRKTAVVTVLEGCDFTINGTVDDSVPDPAAHSVQYTLTLFESGTLPAQVEGTFTATKYSPRTNEIRGGVMLLAQDPSDTVGEEITLTFTNGSTTFRLKANESIVIHGLPSGKKFQLRVNPLDKDLVSTDPDSVFEGELSGESGGSVTSVLKEKLPEAIALNPDGIELSVGDFYTLEAKITPEDISDANGALTWSSSDPSVVTVSEGSGRTNRVHAVGEGTATVTAWTVNAKSASCVVKVVPAVTPPENKPENKPDSGGTPAPENQPDSGGATAPGNQPDSSTVSVPGNQPDSSAVSATGNTPNFTAAPAPEVEAFPPQTGDNASLFALALTLTSVVSLALAVVCAVMLIKGRKKRS